MKQLFVILGVVSFLAISTVANALTGYIDPNGDVGTQQWPVTPPGGATVSPAYSAVDDGVHPDTAGYNPDLTNYLLSQTNGNVDTFDMSTIDMSGGTATKIKVWAYGKYAMNGAAKIEVSTTGGGWTTITDFVFGSASAWKSIEFTGSWPQADLDAVQFRVTSFLGTAVYIYALPGTVTYTTGGGGATPTGKVIMIGD